MDRKRYAIFIFDSDLDWSPRAWIEENEGSKHGVGNYMIRNDLGWIEITWPDDAVIEDYAPDEIDEIRKLFSNFSLAHILWRGGKLFESFSSILPSDHRLYFQDSRGVIYDVREIREKNGGIIPYNIDDMIESPINQ